MKILKALLLFTVSNSFAQLNTYNYNRKLDKVTKEDYYTIPLSPEIIAHSKTGLNDLRIYNISENDTVEVPFMLALHGDKTEEKPVSFQLINDVTHLKCCSFITLKMEKAQVINTITLDILEDNFDKMLTVEGSNDNKEWFTIAGHLRIVGFNNSKIKFRSNTIHFPSSEYNYFRIKFDDDASPRIEVINAYASVINTTKGIFDELNIQNKKQTEDKQQKTSEIILDLKDSYMLSYIKLKSRRKEDFYRNINIYISTGTYHTPKGDEEAWQMVNSGEIVSDQENTFALQNVQAAKIRIDIINYDNQPITLDDINIYSEKAELTARLPASDNLYLAYGRDAAPAPVYDLVHFRDKIPSNLNIVNTGTELFKGSIATPKTTEPLIKNKMWLWIIMGVLILLISFFAMSMIRKENKEN